MSFLQSVNTPTLLGSEVAIYEEDSNLPIFSVSEVLKNEEKAVVATIKCNYTELFFCWFFYPCMSAVSSSCYY